LPRTPQQARILRDQVKSFLSFPYSDYDGTKGNFDKAEPLDQLITGTFGDLAIKIQAGTSAVEKASFNNALRRFLNLLDEQPERSLDLARPLQRVRQDFEWALAAKDVEGSRRYFEELTANGRLSQENIWYLQIQRWASLESWNDIIQHPDLADLLCLRRPTKVTFAILRAMSNVYLEDENLDQNELSLLLNKEPLNGFRDIHLLVNDHLPSDIARIYQKIEELLLDNISDYELVPERIEASGFELAENFWETGQFLEALKVLEDCPDDARKLALTLRICREVPFPNTILVAVELRNTLSSDELGALSQQKETAELLQWLSEQVLDDRVPQGITEWFEAFDKDVSESQLEEIFREHGESWRVDLLTEKEAIGISALMELVVDTPRSGLLMRMLPGIHDLVSTLDPVVKAPISRACFFILAIQDQLTAAELVALHHVVDNLFDIVNTTEREQILAETLNIWARIANPRRVGWFLDMASSIKATSGANDLLSQDVIIQMASIIAGFMPGSLEESFRIPARVILTGIYDLAAWTNIWHIDTHDAVIVPDPFEALAGKSVGIYCLEQVRAMRMSNALKAVSSCSVSLNHHYAGTEALENLAKSSDLMIVITSAAKHAATECIRVNRGQKPIIYIHSTGVSTFLRSVEEFLTS
jgi:hypothetical protein